LPQLANVGSRWCPNRNQDTTGIEETLERDQRYCVLRATAMRTGRQKKGVPHGHSWLDREGLLVVQKRSGA
jgi:hypothetical protein